MLPHNQPNRPNSQDLLRQIYDAAKKQDINRLNELTRQAANIPGMDLSTEQWQKLAQQEEQQRLDEIELKKRQEEEASILRERRAEEIRRQAEERKLTRRDPVKIALMIIGISILAILTGFGGFLAGRKSIPTPSPTPPIIPTATTPSPTDTPTPTQEPTPTASIVPNPDIIIPTATATPIAISRYQIDPAGLIYPPVPLQAAEAWLLDEQDAEVDPPLSNVDIWTVGKSRDPLANSEDYFTTINNGAISIKWNLDTPLYAGLYQVLVLDTMVGSGGAQGYEVLLDGQASVPYRGRAQTIFNTVSIGKQDSDNWLPLGIYQVAQGQFLSVTAQVKDRNKEQPYAIDRLLVVRLSWEAEQMLAGLPEGRVLYSMVDDNQAAFYVTQNNFDTRLAALKQPPSKFYPDTLAWGGSFKSLKDPWLTDMAVIWQAQGRLPAGKYELYVWMPSKNATASVSYELWADGKRVERESPAELNQVDFSAQWVSLGLWILPNEAAVAVRMNISKDANLLADGTQARIGVDAVVLVYAGE